MPKSKHKVTKVVFLLKIMMENLLKKEFYSSLSDPKWGFLRIGFDISCTFSPKETLFIKRQACFTIRVISLRDNSAISIAMLS